MRGMLRGTASPEFARRRALAAIEETGRTAELQARDRTQAVIVAYESGFVSPS